MNDRIKELRSVLGLSQEAFCKALGVSRGVITNIELHKVTPSEAIIRAIIREFNVSEAWLREGVGEMFREKTRDEELSAFFGEVLSDKPEDFRRRLVTVLSRLDVEHWHLLEEMARKLGEAEEKEKADPED